MRRKKIFALIAVLVISAVIPLIRFQVQASNSTGIAIVNPGPDGYPDKWTAGPPRDLNTSDFIFYSNETAVNSTFFVNVTIIDAYTVKNWGVGIIFNHQILQYVSAWRPPDHIFAPVEEMGWTLVAPPPVVEQINETHSIFKWGCTYIMGTPPWSFNGTGTLCQIQFKIIKASCQDITGKFVFDPEWTVLVNTTHSWGIPYASVAGNYAFYFEGRVIHTVTWETQSFTVITTSNCLIKKDSVILDQPNKSLQFNVTCCEIGQLCSINITIPADLLNAGPEEWEVYVNGEPVEYQILATNSTHNVLNIEFTCDTEISGVTIKGTEVVPEFPVLTVLLILMLAGAAILIFRKRIK